ncbi:argininosuccinate lyase [Capronia epimyces CBS 606.96]|uniref:argininosuccinate lyase n=1 Tax=Capronia epimyces CBS 606.96 TaxID=1182542 RepID=W9XZK0_9EURO|nr:argininosuccinate lyase [Capronia epimyces CBS 606.96]EXJ82810.1 argininosuccinate lyase [Capronia epimyces CBS 606.96]
MANPAPTLLWGGRFTGAIDDLMFKFNESLTFDRALCKADVQGSIAFAKGLNQLRILTDDELNQIVSGLKKVEQEWEEGTFAIDPKSDEDIHTANERRLGELIGSQIAGKLHTGRSRNEQIATDMRLWARDQLAALALSLKGVLQVCATQAKSSLPILMPGYTHLQRAQPVRFSHWLLGHATFILGDLQRLEGVQERVSCCPLGVGALAGNPFGIDRDFLARELGFSSVHQNSLAAVADRDFVVEILQWASLLMVHLSRLSEDLILFSTAEFGFVRVADAYSTGSSLMPQKKNPDSLELIRGKAGRVLGQATGFLATLKSLPTSYNKDLQESVEPLLDCVKTVSQCLTITQGVLGSLEIFGDKMKAALTADMLATDVADYLVVKGVPFRQTHHIAGAIVRRAEELGVSIAELPLEDLKQISPLFEADVVQVFDFERSVEKRSTKGGTSRSSVLAQIESIEALVSKP